MTPKEAVEDVFTAVNGRDLDSFQERLAADAVFRFPGTGPIEGRERIGRFLKILFHKYPRLEFRVGRVIADETRAAAEWTNAGENREGEPYANEGVTVLEVEGDHIVYLSDTFKDTSLF